MHIVLLESHTERPLCVHADEEKWKSNKSMETKENNSFLHNWATKSSREIYDGKERGWT